LTFTAGGGGDVNEAAYSYAFPLASVPATTFIPAGGGTTANCPGSSSHPSAAAGHLCIYEVAGSNQSSTPLTGDPATNTGLAGGLYGFSVAVEANAAGLTFSRGSWAVTAP
jgi:hypothetical protein